MSQPSFLWIGQEEDWSRRTLHTLAGRKLAGSTTPQQLQDLTATRFDFALIEDDEQTEEILRSLRRQPGVPPLFVVSRTADASRSSRLESAGADAVLSLPRSEPAPFRPPRPASPPTPLPQRASQRGGGGHAPCRLCRARG